MQIKESKLLMAMASFAVAGLLVIVILAIAIGTHGRTQSASRTPSAETENVGSLIKPPRMQLIDGSTGSVFDTATLKRKPYAVTFLYTRCPDVCPLIGAEIHQALEKMGGNAKRFAVVGLSVDPRGDNLKSVGDWLKIHDEPSNFHYLIGSKAQLNPLWRAWNVAPQIENDPKSSHSAAIYLIGRDGEVADIISAGVPVDPEKLAKAFTAELKH